MNKIFFLLTMMAAAVVLAGCAVFDDAGTDVGQSLEQGISGHGRVVSPDPMGDEFGAYYQ